MNVESAFFIAATAGGLGGCVADSMMHGLDTIKTRMQGQLTSKKTKYNSIKQTYKTILKEEGLRGLYGGYISAAVGSFLSTTVHFGIYEVVKAGLIMNDLPDTLSFFLAGATGDVASSIFYVPSELFKTRLQLQGKYNNPHSSSSHNYRNLRHAIRSVYSNYGIIGMYKGWSATLIRDVPFTALQFTFYENFKKRFLKLRSSSSISIKSKPKQQHHRHYNTKPTNRSSSVEKASQNSLKLLDELISGGLAGMLAGAITTPLDVVKTYLQTQKPTKAHYISLSDPLTTYQSGYTLSSKITSQSSSSSNVWTAAKSIYISQGMPGLWRGLGPRVIWTGCQSTIMFVLYERFVDVLS